MNSISKIAIVSTLGAFMAAPLFAQTPHIEKREQNQQQRIAEGIENGSLTAREASKLEKQEAVLDRQSDRAAADGLTNKEKARIEHRQNVLSRKIYREKHDNQVQPPVRDEVSARQRNQQQRIAEGIEKGSLTPGEAARLEKHEAQLNHEIRHDRRDGGELTGREKAKINHQQNRMSRNIYRAKHNGRRG